MKNKTFIAFIKNKLFLQIATSALRASSLRRGFVDIFGVIARNEETRTDPRKNCYLFLGFGIIIFCGLVYTLHAVGSDSEIEDAAQTTSSSITGTIAPSSSPPILNASLKINPSESKPKAEEYKKSSLNLFIIGDYQEDKIEFIAYFRDHPDFEQLQRIWGREELAFIKTPEELETVLFNDVYYNVAKNFERNISKIVNIKDTNKKPIIQILMYSIDFTDEERLYILPSNIVNALNKYNIYFVSLGNTRLFTFPSNIYTAESVKHIFVKSTNYLTFPESMTRLNIMKMTVWGPGVQKNDPDTQKVLGFFEKKSSINEVIEILIPENLKPRQNNKPQLLSQNSESYWSEYINFFFPNSYWPGANSQKPVNDNSEGYFSGLFSNGPTDKKTEQQDPADSKSQGSGWFGWASKSN